MKKNAKFLEFPKSVTFLYIFPFWNWRGAWGGAVVGCQGSETVSVDIKGLPIARVSLVLLRIIGSPNRLLAADSLELGGTRLQDIPGTRDEVIAVSQLFGEKRLLLGRNATETAFKAEPLADFEIIHIAAHGIASAKFPDRAALVIRIIPLTTETPRRRL